MAHKKRAGSRDLLVDWTFEDGPDSEERVMGLFRLLTDALKHSGDEFDKTSRPSNDESNGPAKSPHL